MDYWIRAKEYYYYGRTLPSEKLSRSGRVVVVVVVVVIVVVVVVVVRSELMWCVMGMVYRRREKSSKPSRASWINTRISE